MVPREKYVEFFDEYKNLRLEHKFLPNLIFNIDETMIDVTTIPQKVIIFKDDQHPVATEEKKSEHITLLLSLPVVGDPLRPLAILPLKTMPDLNEDITKYFDITGQPTGWIIGPKLKYWVENNFLSMISERRAVFGQDCPVGNLE